MLYVTGQEWPVTGGFGYWCRRGAGGRYCPGAAFVRPAAGTGKVASLFFVQYDYTGIAAPDTRWASGEAKNR